MHSLVLLPVNNNGAHNKCYVFATGPDATPKKTKQAGLHPTTSDSAYNPSAGQDLPLWITERVRVCQRTPPSASRQGSPTAQAQTPSDQSHSTKPEFVLYWMRTAIRGHENPALDVAKHQAAQQKLPLLVVAFVLTSHPYPTERRFKFWLEGLRDTQRELRAQVGIFA